jgi:two-component system, NarL family, sensor kinase
MSRRTSSRSGEVLRFAAAGLVAVMALGAILLGLLSRISTAEALNSARERARLAGYGVVEPVTSGDLLTSGKPQEDAVLVLDQLVLGRVLSEQVVRVKIWSVNGQILYSDERQLIGKKYPPKDDHAAVLKSGQIDAERANTNAPENVFEQDSGDLLEVYMPIRASDGTPLIYEQYERYDSIVGNSRRLLGRLALPLIGCVLLLWLVQLPLASQLASRVQQAESQHAHLAEQAATASGRERQRIATNLHDGVVQDLAGLSYELSALVARTDPGPTRDAIKRSAEIARTSMQRVRTSLIELHPPSVKALGLATAVDQLAEPLRRSNVRVNISVNDDHITEDNQALLYRVAHELLRNVGEHSAATLASIAIEQDQHHTTMVISDNGQGIDVNQQQARRAEGHLGMELHRALVAQAGGTMRVDSTPGNGTTITVELPT